MLALVVVLAGIALLLGILPASADAGVRSTVTPGQAGSVDPTFNSAGAGPNGFVEAIAFQSDGKIVIGGSFSSYNGITATNIIRLNPDGSPDPSFSSSGVTPLNAYSDVIALAIQSDGKILVGGGSDPFTPAQVSHVIRLNANGSLDSTFNPGGAGANNNVYALALQSDGKILAGGRFTSYNGTTTNTTLLRLKADGTPDPTFSTTVTSTVHSLALQPDSKIVVVAGGIVKFGDGGRVIITRLNPNGTSDSTFNATGYDPLNPLAAMALQPDGKIVVGGYGVLIRFKANGSLDTGFNNNSTTYSGTVETLAIENDGKIIVGGYGSFSNPVTNTNIVRLKTDGTFDPTFDVGSGTNDAVDVVSFQGNGKLLVGGQFTAINGQNHHFLGRLFTTNVTIAAVNGNTQATFVNTAFDNPLIVRVADANNAPISDTLVTFTAPTAGASGSFAGGGTVYTGTTNISGVVTSPVFTANSTPGSYTITATTAAINSPAIFHLTNISPCASLEVTSTQDDGSCGTLRAALVVAEHGSSKNVTITLSAGSVISLTNGLNLTNGVVVTTSVPCGAGANNTLVPPIILQGTGTNSGAGLTLSNNNQLYGLWVRGFSSVQIKAPPGSSTKMQCVRSSKV